jgi:hypothetical protein
MNLQKLKLVRDAIYEHKHLFQMEDWFRRELCGTAACIAGWALTVGNGADMPPQEVEWVGDLSKHAGDFLEIEPHAEYNLFYLRWWPLPILPRDLLGELWESNLAQAEAAIILLDGLIREELRITPGGWQQLRDGEWWTVSSDWPSDVGER